MAAALTRAALRCVLAVALLGVSVANVHAATVPEGLGVQVTPLIESHEMARGDMIRTTVTVTAPNMPVNITFEHADFGFADDGSVVFVEDDAKQAPPFSTRGWISVPRTSWTLKKGESVTIPLRISVPVDATSGVHLGAAFFRASVASMLSTAPNVQVDARAGTLFFINVAGAKQSVPVVDIDTDALVSNGKINADLVLRNKGDTFYRVSGVARLRKSGSDTGADAVPERYSIPGVTRRIPLKLGEKLAPGRYKITVQLTSNVSGYGDFKRTAVVWVIPWWMRIAAAAIVIALVAGGVWLARRIIRSRRAAAAELADHDDDLDDPSGEIYDVFRA